MISLHALARLGLLTVIALIVLHHHAELRASQALPDQPAFVARAPEPPPPNGFGLARMRHAPTPCDVATFSPDGPGAPYFVADGVPKPWQPFRVQWTTKPTTPGEPPPWPAILLVSFEMIVPTPLAGLGAPGCYLQVPPEFIMLPSPGGILTQQGGRVNLDWTPNLSQVGLEFHAQLLVSAPGANAAGMLLSPALHVIVGS